VVISFVSDMSLLATANYGKVLLSIMLQLATANYSSELILCLASDAV
jgi:hypothetical protein